MRHLSAIILLAVLQTAASAADLSADQQLVDACHRLNEFRVIQLLRSGATLNSKFGKPRIGGPIRPEWTPLLALANSPTLPARNSTATKEHLRSKRLSILRLLLSHGCDINAVDKYGHTALHTSIKKRDVDFCELLLLFNPNINTSASEGHLDYESPIHSAYWSPKLTDLLIARGAERGKKDSRGNSAAESRNLKMFSDFMHAHDRVPTNEECAKLGFESPLADTTSKTP